MDPAPLLSKIREPIGDVAIRNSHVGALVKRSSGLGFGFFGLQ